VTPIVFVYLYVLPLARTLTDISSTFIEVFPTTPIADADDF
jgi:hypothetical protein